MEENNDFLNLTEEDQLNSNGDQNNASTEEGNKKNTDNQEENNSNQETPANLTETIASNAQGLIGTVDNQQVGEEQQPNEENNNQTENLSEMTGSVANAADALVDSMVNKAEGLENTEEPKAAENELDTTNKEPEKVENEPENNDQEPTNTEEQVNTENISEINGAFTNTVDAMADALANQPENTEKEPENPTSTNNEEQKGNEGNVSEIDGTLENAADAMAAAINNQQEDTEREPENLENQGNTETDNPSETAGTLANAVGAMANALIPQDNNEVNTEPQDNQENIDNTENQETAANPENLENNENTDNQDNAENPTNPENPDNQDTTIKEIGQEIQESLFPQQSPTDEATQPIQIEEEEEGDNQSDTNPPEIQTDETAKEYVYDSEIVTLHSEPNSLHDRYLYNHVVDCEIFSGENDQIRCLFSVTSDTRVFENYCKYLRLSNVTTFHFTELPCENGDGFDTFFSFCTGKDLTTLKNPTEEQISVALRSFNPSYVIPCSPEDSNKLETYEKVSKIERFASKSMIENVNDQISEQKVMLNTEVYTYENPVTYSSFLHVSIDALLGHICSISGDEFERIAKLDHEYTYNDEKCSIFDNDFDFHSMLGINNVREIELSPGNFVHCVFSSTEDSVLEKFLSLTQIGSSVSFHFTSSPNGHVNYLTLCTGKTLISLVNPPQSQLNIVFEKVKKSFLIPCGLNDKNQLFFYDYMNKITKIASDRDVAQIDEEIKAVQEAVYVKKWKYDIASSYGKFLNVSYTAFIGYLVRRQYVEPIVQPSEFRSFDVHDFILLRRLDYGKKVALNWPEGKVYILKEYKDKHKFNQAIYLYKNNKMSRIIPFFGQAINNENYLVFALASRGTLKEVATKDYVNISLSEKISIQLVFLLAYLHMTDTKPCNISADSISIDWDYNAYLSDLDGFEKVINCTPDELDVNNLGIVLHTLVTGQSPLSSFTKGIPSIYKAVSHLYELTRKQGTTACDLVSDILSNKLFSKEEKLINSLLAELPHPELEKIEAFEDCSFDYFKFNCREININQINFIKTLKFGKTATIQFISDDNNNSDENRIFIFETNKFCGTLKNATPQVVNLIASKMKNSTVVAVTDRDLDIFFEYYNFDLIQNFIREPQLSVFRKNATEALKDMNEFDEKFIVEETLALSYAVSNPSKYKVLMEEPISIAPQFPNASLLNDEFNPKNLMPENMVRLVEVYDNFNILCLYSTEEDYTFNEFMRDFSKDQFVVVHFSDDFVSFCSNKKLLLLNTNNQVNKVISLIKDTKVYGVCPIDRSRLFSFTNFDIIQSFATQKEMDELCEKVKKNKDNFIIQDFECDKGKMTYSTFFYHTKCAITGYYLLNHPDFEHNSQSLSKMVEQSIDFASSIIDDKSNLLQPQTPTQTFADFDTEEDLKKAFNLYTLAAERNDPSAFFNLGLMYSTGQGVEKDKEKAVEYYTKSADLGNAKAQFNLGLMYYKGEGVEVNKQEAARLYQLAADQGLAKAQSNLGLMYSKGDGIEQNYEKAIELYEKAVEQNDQDAQLNLGMMCEIGQGLPIDKERAIDLYTKSAENGNAKAQFNLGVLYHNGEKGILKKDNNKAVNYYSLASSKGLAKAQFNLGCLYSKGDDDIPIDKKMAAQLFQLAADQGDSDAQLNLGAMYAKGEGVEKNKEKTVELYKKSAKQGNPKAQFNLAVMYSKGDGVDKNIKKASKYYQKASDQDISQASFNLGVIYFRGAENVEEDKTKAAELFEKTTQLNPKNSKALFNLAIMNMKGEGIPKNEEKALDYFEKAAELDNKDALLNLGLIYIEGGCGVEPNKKKAFSYYKRAADLGNDKAQLNLGLMLQNGEGCDKDIDKAKEYFQLAANQGNAQAQVNLGLLLIGRDDELKEAEKKQLEDEAEKGNTESMYELGCKFQEEDDVENAIKWFNRAANKDNSKAQLELGKIYLYGKQTEVDLDKSELFLQSAVKNNEPDASVHLEQLNEEREKIQRSIELKRKEEEEEAERQRLEREQQELAEKQRREEEEEAERQRLEREQQELAEKQRKEEEEAERQRLEKEQQELAEQQRQQQEEEERKRQEQNEIEQNNNIEVHQNEEDEKTTETKENEQQEQQEETIEPKTRSINLNQNLNENEEENDNQAASENENEVELTIEEPKKEEETVETATTNTINEEEKPKPMANEDEDDDDQENAKLAMIEEEEEEAVEQTLKLDVTSDNETPENEREEEAKLKDTATLSFGEEEEEEEETAEFSEDEHLNSLQNSLEDRIKSLNTLSGTKFRNVNTTLNEVHDLIEYSNLTRQISAYTKSTNSLKTIVDEAETVINSSPQPQSQSLTSSNLPSLRKNGSKGQFTAEFDQQQQQQNSDEFSDGFGDDDDELNRLKSDVQKLEALVAQLDQQIANASAKQQPRSNNSVRPQTLIREPDQPRKHRVVSSNNSNSNKDVKIQSPRSARTKVRHLEKKAEAGDPAAQYSLGALYSIGQSVEKDKEKGFEFYLKSADQGFMNGQFAVASCYTYGRGTKIDLHKAFEYYLKAAEQGHDKSQFAVGHFYDCGYGGVEKDHEKAVEWFKLAAAQNHQGAIEQLRSESDETASDK